MKVLIAEDNPLVGIILMTVIKSFGYQVELATDGETAWTRFKTGGFRVVVSDWMMPHLDGLGLCRRIRGSAPGDVYFILLTGGGDVDSDEACAREAGVDYFLRKPLNHHQLMHCLALASWGVDSPKLTS